MRTLVMDCSTEACSAALFDGTELADARFEVIGRGHAERLIPMIRELPGNGKAERVIAGLGPGSFTGVRVAIAAARALALAWDSECFGFPTLALVAALAREEAGPVPVGVAMTGGHGEWFVEGFGANGRVSRPLASLAPDAAIRATAEDVVAGSQAAQLVERRGAGRALDIRPDVRGFMLLPQATLSVGLEPIYGRGPDARLPGAIGDAGADASCTI